MTKQEAIEKLLDAKVNKILTVGISTGEAAMLLDRSEATVKRWANTGKLTTSATVGGHRNYNLDAVLAFKANLPEKRSSDPDEVVEPAAPQ
jgi:transposase